MALNKGDSTFKIHIISTMSDLTTSNYNLQIQNCTRSSDSSLQALLLLQVYHILCANAHALDTVYTMCLTLYCPHPTTPTLFGPITIKLLTIIISQPPFIKGQAVYILNKK